MRTRFKLQVWCQQTPACHLTLLLPSWSSPSLESSSWAEEAGLRELSPTSQEKPAATCSLDGATTLGFTCWEREGGKLFFLRFWIDDGIFPKLWRDAGMENYRKLDMLTFSGSCLGASSSSLSSSSLKYTSTPLSLSSAFVFFVVFFFCGIWSAWFN